MDKEKILLIIMEYIDDALAEKQSMSQERWESGKWYVYEEFKRKVRELTWWNNGGPQKVDQEMYDAAIKTITEKLGL